MTQASDVRTDALAALRRGLSASRPDVVMDDKGYVPDFRDNLLPDVVPSDFEADLRQGSGDELGGKFRAAHSSSALAVNVFAPFRHRPEELQICGTTDFDSMRFERKCPTGLGGTPPNLDVVFEAGNAVIAVESKCTEYLSLHRAAFSSSYRDRISDARAGSPWFKEMLRLTEAPEAYRWLDAAQLIKHALGLAHTFPDRKVTLLYVFWQPQGAELCPVYAQHQAECRSFSKAIAGGAVMFEFMDYRALWDSWRALKRPDWLIRHLDRLTIRYCAA